MTLRDWVRLPTGWIIDKGLRTFRWEPGKGADNAAALMTLAVIAHHAEDDTGLSRLTYEQLHAFTGGLSRAKVAAGLQVLENGKIIERNAKGRSGFQLLGYDKTKGWAKFPARRLYGAGHIAAFSDFHLRRPAELNALKLYFLFAALRDRNTNMAQISYDKIDDYTEIGHGRIKGGLNVLAANGLVHVEHMPTTDGYTSSAYRLAHLESRKHMGTSGRALVAGQVADVLAE